MLQQCAAGRRVLIACAVLVVRGGYLSAQTRPAACPRPVPSPLADVVDPSVTVRLMAEGEFPDADVAAARAINLLSRDLITDRAPVNLLSTVDVQRRIAPSLDAARDLRGIRGGGKLLTAIVKRIGDSVIVSFNTRSSGTQSKLALRMRTVTARVDDIARVALVLAEAAVQTSEASPVSMGTASPALGSVDAGDAYILGLAEALSPSPDALRRARAALGKASSLAPSVADTWRWLARVELSLVESNRGAGPNALRGLQVSMLKNAAKSAQLAPRSANALVTLANAYLASGNRRLAESTFDAAKSLHADGPEVGRLAASLSRIRDQDADAMTQLSAAVRMSPRDASLLVELASLARLRGAPSLACHALNAAIAADEELASAYALRALMRADLGERRAAWVDAEVATRLGHPEWGERAAAVLDAKFGNAEHATERLRTLGGLRIAPTNYLDALLLAQAAIAIARRGAVSKLADSWPCNDLRRGALVRDLRSLGVRASGVCKSATARRFAPPPSVGELPERYRHPKAGAIGTRFVEGTAVVSATRKPTLCSAHAPRSPILTACDLASSY